MWMAFLSSTIAHEILVIINEMDENIKFTTVLEKEAALSYLHKLVKSYETCF